MNTNQSQVTLSEQSVQQVTSITSLQSIGVKLMSSTTQERLKTLRQQHIQVLDLLETFH